MTTVVTHPDTRRHDPGGEVWLGTRTPGTEVAGRVDAIEQALRAEHHRVVAAQPHADLPLLAVHDEALVEYLRSAWEEWDGAGLADREGADRVVPYLFPTEGLLQGLPARGSVAPHARAGVFCYDTMTLIGPGTWSAVRAAADCALTATDLVASGERAAYALCRPPGHHATRMAFGGSCYLNNAAIAAASLRGRGMARVAVLDVDAHHGNGTQSIFYDRDDVVTASLHVDPGAGWFPHHVGFADERGRGAGEGANLNVPLAEGTGDAAWLTALDRLTSWVADSGADALVVPLGVDAAADDPESPLRVSEDGFRRAGRAIAALGLPTVVVQEGGYHLPTLGSLVAAFLGGLGE